MAGAENLTARERAPSAVPGEARRARIPHVAALDGLRGAAVAGVLLFHGGHLSGGYLGVDLFFVLSGFLITSLLLAESGASGSIRLGSFWARRARRLLPALFGMLFGVALYCLLLAESHELAQIRDDAIATISYVANWRGVFATRDYFQLFRSPSPLEHTWSLAIEEQFYLIWPLVFVVLLAWRRNAIARSVFVTAAVGSVASALLLVALYDPADPSRSYYGTDTRAAGILLGAALAAALVVWGPVRNAVVRRTVDALGLCGVVVLAITWTRLGGDSSTLYHGGFVVSQLAAVAIIAAVVQPRPGAISRALSWKPLCGLGLISYGVYLWHWPVDIVLNPERTGIGGWPLFFLQCAVTLGIALVSYYLLEMPIRHGAGSARTWAIAIPAALVTLALVFVFVQPRIDASADAASPFGGSAFDGTDLDNLSRAKLVEQRNLLSVAYTNGQPWAVVVGDSVAFTLASGAPRRADAPLAVATAAILGCGIVPGTPRGATQFHSSKLCEKWPKIWRRAAQVFDPGLIVLLPGPTDITGREIKGTRVGVFSDAFRDELVAQLQQANRIAGDAHARLVLLSMMCLSPSSTDLRYQREASDPRRARWANAIYREFARTHPETVRYLDLRQHVCPAGASTPELNGKDITSDGVHLTEPGSRALWRWLGPRLASLVPAAAVPTGPGG